MVCRTNLACGLMLVALGADGASAAEVVSAVSRFALNIPAEPLGQALTDFAQQTGLQVLYEHRSVPQLISPRLSGSYSGVQALETLLANTGLRFEFVTPKAVWISSEPEESHAAQKSGSSSSTGRDQSKADSQESATSNAVNSGQDFSKAGNGMKHRSIFARFTGALAAAFATAATAQTDGVQTKELEELVVTGSRVISNGDSSPTPVTVIAADDIKTVQPTTIADGLNLLPVFSGSRTPTSNPLTTGGAGGGSAASNQLNLRNVGSLRTLVLFDGQRIPPTLINGNTDVDMIPQMLLKRVDTVTGGVSAVYGSDAVAGVVNFITDRDFNGIKANAQYGTSEYSDNNQFNAGIAIGTNLAGGRGHFEASYEYRDAQGVLQRSSRPWNKLYAIEGAGTPASPYRLVQNVHLATITFGGLVVGPTPSATVNNPYYDQQFAVNGVLTPLVHGGASGSVCCEVGGDGGYYDSSMVAPLKSHQAFLRFDFDLTDSLKWHAVGAANLKKNTQNFIYPSLNSVTLSAQNAYLAQNYRTAFTTAGRTTFTFSKLITQLGPQQTLTDSKQYYFNTGLEGELGKFNWGFDLNFGDTRLQNEITGNLNNERLSAALDAVTDSSGRVVCNTDLTNPGLRPGCVPLNVFGPTSSSTDALNFILGNHLHYTGRTRFYDATAHIAGDLFSTWAGPVTSALSGEWRRLSYNATSDALPTDRANCTGLRFNCTATTLLWNMNLASFPKVSNSVKEVALETEVPLLKDLPVVQSLSLNGAGRYTSYDTSGDYWTWKLGLDWHLNDSFRVRATQSSDIRAPTLNDLFAPQSVNIVAVEDLLTRQTPSIASVGGGNPDLRAEKGRTTTAGIVFKPTAFPGFSMAVDYFHLRITDAITAQGGFGATFQNACYDSGGSSPYCLLQTRPTPCFDRTNPACTAIANTATGWSGRAINISEIETNGADFEVNYQGRAFEHRFSVRGLVTYQPHIYYRQPSIATLDMGGLAYGPTPLVASPSTRVTGLFSFEATDNLRVDVIERWRSPMRLGDPSFAWIGNHVASYATTGLNLNYAFKSTSGQPEIFLNVQNLFDKDPPPAGQYGSGTVPGQFGGWSVGDDPVGRYYTAGVRIRL